jgi:hypothetical protein
MKSDREINNYITKFWFMTFGIQPREIDDMSIYEMEIYTHLIPLYIEFLDTRMENCIKKSISEIMG